MKSESEIKILEDKLNDIYSICLRAGIGIYSKGELNVFVLLIASIYLDYGYTDLKTILKKINEVCNINSMGTQSLKQPGLKAVTLVL